MNGGAWRVQRVYLVLLLLHTLAAFHLKDPHALPARRRAHHAQAFAANAFFTAGLVLFEVPTEVVADMRGGRLSYLLVTPTLALSTLRYLVMWRISAPFSAWAAASHLLLGRGRQRTPKASGGSALSRPSRFGGGASAS